MTVRGLLIDCARLLERREYYFRLVDFMADWGLNLLLVHFTDDAGCAVKLPGLERLGMKHAFSTQEIKTLIRHAARRGIEVVPEVETFGHTRYLTDRQEYRHLFTGRHSRRLRFNAIDPLHPDTAAIMRRVLRATARLFPSRYLHVGCDEVNLKKHGHAKNADTLWADYVNRIFAMTRACGKEPLFWADHAAKNQRIAQALDKNVTAVWWDYRGDLKPDALLALRQAGFKRIIGACSTGNYYARFLTPRRQLRNVDRMACYVRQYKLPGLINTVWETQRYPQGAMYYGIAYAAYRQQHPHATMRAFHTVLVRKVFGTGLTPEVLAFLAGWPDLDVNYQVTLGLMRGEPLTAEQRRRLRRVRQIGRRLLPLTRHYVPKENADIWEAMVLAAKAAWVTAEGRLLAGHAHASAARQRAYNQLLRDVRQQMARDWDATRFPDDPKKFKPHFPGPVSEAQHALAILHRLPLAR